MFGNKCNVKSCSSAHLRAVFPIPCSAEMRLKWLRLTGSEDLLQAAPKEVFKRARICEKHFQPSDFVGKQLIHLKTGAVPSVFADGHQPLPGYLMLEWLRRYPQRKSGKIRRMTNIQQRTLCSLLPATQHVLENPMETSHEDSPASEQLSRSEVLETASVNDKGLPGPVMQMLPGTQLVQSRVENVDKNELKNVLLSGTNPQFGLPKVGGKIFLLQVEKLPKRMSDSTSLIPSLAARHSVIKYQQEETQERDNLASIDVKTETVEPETNLLSDIQIFTTRIKSETSETEAFDRFDDVEMFDESDSISVEAETSDPLLLPPLDAHSNVQLSDGSSLTNTLSKPFERNLLKHEQMLPQIPNVKDSSSVSIGTKTCQIPLSSSPEMSLATQRMACNIFGTAPKVVKLPTAAGQRVFFLQVEKLPKSSRSSSSSHVHCCDNVESHETASEETGKVQKQRHLRVPSDRLQGSSQSPTGLSPRVPIIESRKSTGEGSVFNNSSMLLFQNQPSIKPTLVQKIALGRQLPNMSINYNQCDGNSEVVSNECTTHLNRLVSKQVPLQSVNTVVAPKSEVLSYRQEAQRTLSSTFSCDNSAKPVSLSSTMGEMTLQINAAENISNPDTLSLHLRRLRDTTHKQDPMISKNLNPKHAATIRRLKLQVKNFQALLKKVIDEGSASEHLQKAIQKALNASTKHATNM